MEVTNIPTALANNIRTDTTTAPLAHKLNQQTLNNIYKPDFSNERQSIQKIFYKNISEIH